MSIVNVLFDVRVVFTSSFHFVDVQRVDDELNSFDTRPSGSNANVSEMISEVLELLVGASAFDLRCSTQTQDAELGPGFFQLFNYSAVGIITSRFVRFI